MKILLVLLLALAAFGCMPESGATVVRSECVSIKYDTSGGEELKIYRELCWVLTPNGDRCYYTPRNSAALSCVR